MVMVKRELPIVIGIDFLDVICPTDRAPCDASIFSMACGDCPALD